MYFSIRFTEIRREQRELLNSERTRTFDPTRPATQDCCKSWQNKPLSLVEPVSHLVFFEFHGSLRRWSWRRYAVYPSFFKSILKEAHSSFSGLRVEVFKLQSRREDKLWSPSHFSGTRPRLTATSVIRSSRYNLRPFFWGPGNRAIKFLTKTHVNTVSPVNMANGHILKSRTVQSFIISPR